MSLAFYLNGLKLLYLGTTLLFFLKIFVEISVLPLFLCRCAECHKDNMVSYPTDEDPRLDSPPKCEAFLVNGRVMPLGEFCEAFLVDAHIIPLGEFYQLKSPGLLHSNHNKDKSSSQEVEHYLLKQFTTTTISTVRNLMNECIARNSNVPLNIILHGWPLPADPTCVGLHADSHWSPNGWDLAAPCLSACIYN